MKVGSVRIDALRSLHSVSLELEAGITVILGPNGAGKTNLIEAIYFALTGRSFRTADRRDLIPFNGGTHARSEARVELEDGNTNRFAAAVSRTDGRRYSLDGEEIDTRKARSFRPPILVFSPDRLSLIKGPPGERRAHMDAFFAALRPSRGDLRRLYGKALAQRNAMLMRVASGSARRDELTAWDQTLAAAAVPLIEARLESIDQIRPHYSELAGELGLPGEGSVAYRARFTGSVAEFSEALAERRETDLSQGRTGLGPHLDELVIEQDGHSIRKFGSQGQQRLSLLALLLAERAVLVGTWSAPLLLLDDVLSELDPSMRRLLEERLREGGQSLITAADPDAIPTGDAIGLVEIAEAGESPTVIGADG